MISNYTEDSIKSLDWREHIRMRPGMYIGKLGDGTAQDDGIYVLLKEVIDNSIDEFVMGFGKVIEISLDEYRLQVRDYGRGIPLGKIIECVSKINTGAKYDSGAFQKSVGLNGVGTKAVNALSKYFSTQAFRDGKTKIAEFEQGFLTNESAEMPTNEKNGTLVVFEPDESIFGEFRFISSYIESMLWNYAYLNTGLTILFNGEKIFSENGLLDLLTKNIGSETLYPIIHIKDKDFECAFTHTEGKYGEEYFSFVNGQHTTQGGTHLAAFREAIVKTIREFYKKDFHPNDVKQSIYAAISIKIQEPVFESQTKTKLGSQYMEPGGTSIRNFINDIVKKHLDDYLHINSQTAEVLLKKISLSEKERKEIANIKKLSKESIRKVSLHNKKLRDCRTHFNSKDDRRHESTIFITEGDSASGSITKSRDVNTQAVFSLKGKPLNSYGMSKKVVYENEEFNLLQSALNIEEGVEHLRYNKIVIATDADVDGMHIRLLLLTFFLQFYPEIVKAGHLFILQTPLFRVRNKQKTIYAYNEEEKQKAITQLGKNPEITRFKGLGEISPDEFKGFIGKTIRLEPVILSSEKSIKEILDFYMGKNTPHRQQFIVNNLRLELDVVSD